MKITRVESIGLAIPYDSGGPKAAWGGQGWERLNVCLVRIETADGLVGWGEAFSYNCLGAVQAMIEQSIAPVLVGEDASDIAGISHRLQQGLHLFGRYGITIFGISGVDIALWDLAGKRAGLPVGRLLGGAGAPAPITGYASLLKYVDPELVAERTRSALGEGYRAIKLHETTEDAVAAARDAMGPDLPLCIDTNCPWSPAEADEMAIRFAGYDPHWLEEPIFPPEDFRSLARLQAESGVPLASGENLCTAWQFREMLEADAVRYAQPSVTKVGGLTELVKVGTLARMHGVTVMPHSPYFGPGWLATLQWAGAQPDRQSWVERFYTALEATLYGPWVSPVGETGTFAVPTGPGLGVEPDPDVIREYRV